MLNQRVLRIIDPLFVTAEDCLPLACMSCMRVDSN
jgi:hypothetical protein